MRIVAPHFVAGLEIERGFVVKAAPIVKYMVGWSAIKAKRYARSKGWWVQ